jgi:hypothetical protein
MNHRRFDSGLMTSFSNEGVPNVRAWRENFPKIRNLVFVPDECKTHCRPAAVSGVIV